MVEQRERSLSKKKFDFLVAVSIDEKNYSHCWIDGQIPKPDFILRKQIADGSNSGLELGTWFMDKGHLDEIPVDWFHQRELCPICRERGVFGYKVKSQIVWYCREHRIGMWWADARRDQMVGI